MVAHVGEHASASTFAPVVFNAVLRAVFQIDLIVYYLIPSEYHRRIHAPHEEIGIVRRELPRYIFFHCEMKRKFACDV